MKTEFPEPLSNVAGLYKPITALLRTIKDYLRPIRVKYSHSFLEVYLNVSSNISKKAKTLFSLLALALIKNWKLNISR